MAGERFQTLDVSGFHIALHDLHARVATGCGRIEVTGLDPDHVCVLISKTELECLEQALEILSGTAGYKDMCNEVTLAAAQSGGSPLITETLATASSAAAT